MVRRSPEHEAAVEHEVDEDESDDNDEMNVDIPEVPAGKTYNLRHSNGAFAGQVKTAENKQIAKRKSRSSDESQSSEENSSAESKGNEEEIGQKRHRSWITRTSSQTYSRGVLKIVDEDSDSDSEQEQAKLIRKICRSRNTDRSNFSKRSLREDSHESESLNARPIARATRSSARKPPANHVANTEEEPEENGSETEDMYSRLKNRRASRVNYCETRTIMQKEEPISRRLRDRKPKSVVSNLEPLSTLDRDDYRRRRFRNRRKSRKRLHSTSSDSSSSSDSDEGAYSRRGNKNSERPEKAKSKAVINHLQPTEIDPSITFSSVGGLEHVISKLREVVMLPLMYKEFYSRRGLNPAKGILFHGPPGTGKTMLARALANECSSLGGSKVSFFVRKGADLMSKWVGESEKQIRNLFEQAAALQPSIIFFDEIDGLAPARSLKTDQVYNSVISTFLAEIDGLKHRGDVIVIGATNRIDALDSALRRPGRFDFEVAFLLPDKAARKEIIQTYVSNWEEIMDENILDQLSEKTVGFSGADLQLLCAEASLSALRRRYPQIYSSKQKYLLDYKSVQVEDLDWSQAITKVKSTCSRALYSVNAAGNPLPDALETLLSSEVQNIVGKVTEMFPHANDLSVLQEPAPKRFLVLSKNEDSGLDQYVIPAVLHRLEALPVFTLQPEHINTSDTASEVWAVTQVFSEATRANKAAIVLLPSINYLFENMTSQGKHFLRKKIASAFPAPIFILAYCEKPGTVDGEEDNLWSEIQSLFSGRIYEVQSPDRNARTAFYSSVLSTDALLVRRPIMKEPEIMEELPLAPPPPPPKPSVLEIKRMQKKDEQMLRNLRQYLREVIAKLARNKKFEDFVRPVDEKEVPDYGDIIKNPMCLEKMMFKLDQGQYLCAQDFLQDIYLIQNNAAEYNPAEDYQGITHRAHQLVDQTHIIIEGELDSDFEAACEDIAYRRRNAKESSMEVTAADRNVPHADSGSTAPNSPEIGSSRRSLKSRQSSQITGTVKCNGFDSARRDTGKSSDNKVRECIIQTEQIGGQHYELVPCADTERLIGRISKFAKVLGKYTEEVGISDMLDLRYQLILAIRQDYCMADKGNLLQTLDGIIVRFLDTRVPNRTASLDSYISLKKARSASSESNMSL